MSGTKGGSAHDKEQRFGGVDEVSGSHAGGIEVEVQMAVRAVAGLAVRDERGRRLSHIRRRNPS